MKIYCRLIKQGKKYSYILAEIRVNHASTETNQLLKSLKKMRQKTKVYWYSLQSIMMNTEINRIYKNENALSVDNSLGTS